MNIHYYASDVAFTPSVKAVAERATARAQAYARMEEKGSWQTRDHAGSRGFHRRADSVFLATANAEGQPYIQHRGGPAGIPAGAGRERPSALPISPATGNTSPPAISRKIPRRSCS